MDINGLTVGNLLLKDGEPHFITLADLIEIDKVANGLSGVDYQPVSLTEEWLIKANFEIEITYDRYLPDQKAYYKAGLIFNAAFELATTDGTGYNVITIGQPLKYVHSLQNLFFALSGKELGINLR